MMTEGRYILISTCDLKINRICYIMDAENQRGKKAVLLRVVFFFAFLFQYSDPVYISIFLYHVTILTQFRLIVVTILPHL